MLARMTVQTGARPDRDPVAMLAALGDLRVWSVVTTIFGDAVLPRGGVASATALAAITGQMGIRPEALRVALHRLVMDGWIARERRGRNSFYRLSDAAARQSRAAAARIYAKAPAPAPRSWRFAVTPDDTPRAEGAIALRPGIALLTGPDEPVPKDALVIEGRIGAVPAWLRQGLFPPERCAASSALLQALQAVEPDRVASPLLAVTLRTLAVHQWRRLVLRSPDLPPAFHPADWQGERCRARLAALLAGLAPLSEPWMTTEFGPLGG